MDYYCFGRNHIIAFAFFTAIVENKNSTFGWINVMTAMPLLSICARDDKSSPLHSLSYLILSYNTRNIFKTKTTEKLNLCLRKQPKTISHNFRRWFDFNCIFSFVNTAWFHWSVLTISFSQLPFHQKYYIVIHRHVVRLRHLSFCQSVDIFNEECYTLMNKLNREKIRNNQRDVSNYQFIISRNTVCFFFVKKNYIQTPFGLH